MENAIVAVPAPDQLIRVTQLPVIEEHLRAMKDQVEQRTAEVMELACSPETLSAVKNARAELNKEFSDLEAARKAVKEQIEAPYKNFLATFKDCISTPYERAIADLGKKINDTEAGIKQGCEDDARAYFAELATANGVGWLAYEQGGIKISLSDAKSVHHNKTREQVAAFVTGVAEAAHSIAGMENAEEIMAEFQQSLNMAAAIAAVNDRHRREKQAAEEAERLRQRMEQERQHNAEISAAAPAFTPAPTPVQAPAPAPAPIGKVYVAKFAVHGSMAQLRKLKEFMIQEGIEYESI